MARKITVLGENRDVKKCVAALLVRRLIADWVIENISIRMRPLNELTKALPVERKHRQIANRHYEHHIEPRFERLTVADSAWLRYLEGWKTWS